MTLMDSADSNPIELEPPPIDAYRDGNTGIPYYTTLDSGRPGPHVLVNALIHGNEYCGAIALDFLFRQAIRPHRGRLSLGFANVEAYRRFDPDDPTASRFVDEDMNRVWDEATLSGPRQSVELDRAREIRPLIDTVDVLLDLHSMQNRTVPLSLSGPWAKGRELARAVGTPASIVVDAGHAAGTRLRDYGPFGDPDDPHNALLVECGQHWEAPAADVAIESTLRFLVHVGILEPEAARPYLAADTPAAPERQRVIEVTDVVTIETDRFSFAKPFIGMECLPVAGSIIGRDGDRPIVTPYDNCILIMPSRRLVKGQTAVRLGRTVE